MDTKERKRIADRGGGKASGSGSGTRKRTGEGKPAQRKARPQKQSVPVKKPPEGKPVRRRKPETKQPGPEVVYTQPGPFNMNRFLLRLVTVVAVVFALIFGMAIFFRVKDVTVAGTDKYSYWDVRGASGILDGENLLTLSEAKVSSNILSKLPYVKSVRVGINLPDTVKIEIKELDIVYAIEASDGSHWLIRYDGVVVDETNPVDAGQYAKIEGVKIEAPAVGEIAKAAEPVPETTEATEETLAPAPVTVRASEQLDAALRMIQCLEHKGIFGEVVSLDVTRINQLEMWYEDRFQIILGDVSGLDEKITWIKTAIETQLSTYDSGVLDVSQAVQPVPGEEYKVIYTPFD